MKRLIDKRLDYQFTEIELKIAQMNEYMLSFTHKRNANPNDTAISFIQFQNFDDSLFSWVLPEAGPAMNISV